MAKRLTEKQKQEILQGFQNGETVDFLSKKYNFNKLTIVRNLKKSLGEQKYRKFLEMHKSLKIDYKHKDTQNTHELEVSKDISNLNNDLLESGSETQIETEFTSIASFIEIAPLDCEIDNIVQKDFSSVPISEVNFPKTVYMIVDRKIELETKLLKDYPEWQFLSEDELNRKTIEIHDELKIAKSLCNKEQKVIKVPNTNVFKLVAPFLISKGISRIVNRKNLIAL